MKETARGMSAAALCSLWTVQASWALRRLMRRDAPAGLELGKASGLKSFFCQGEVTFIDARMILVTSKSNGITSLFSFYRHRSGQRIT